MKRSVATAFALTGLLAVASAAAAINVRVLDSVALEPAQVLTHSSGGVTTLRALPSASPHVSPSMPATASPRPRPSRSDSAEPSTVSPSEDPTGAESADRPERSGRSHEPRPGGPGRPPLSAPPVLTIQQMDLLRIAAMAHVRPDVVLAVAKGEVGVDPRTVAVVQSIADYVGVDLSSLKDVTQVPALGDRGHGGPDERGGRNSDY